MITVEELVTQVEPIDLAELITLPALQTRVDSKYLITVGDLDRLIGTIKDTVRVLQVENRCSQTYDTVYFDSRALSCFDDHLQRRRLSYKLRTRVYRTSGLCVFEVKMRDGRGSTVKVKIDHTVESAMQIGPAATDFYRRSIADHYGIVPSRNFRPSLRTTYDRVTLVGRETEERTTVDHSLHFFDPDDGVEVGSLRSDLVLVETKSATGTGSVDRALWAAGLRPQSISKYCIGVGMVHPELAANRYFRSTASAFAGVRRTVEAGSPTVTARRRRPELVR